MTRSPFGGIFMPTHSVVCLVLSSWLLVPVNVATTSSSVCLYVLKGLTKVRSKIWSRRVSVRRIVGASQSTALFIVQVLSSYRSLSSRFLDLMSIRIPALRTDMDTAVACSVQVRPFYICMHILLQEMGYPHVLYSMCCTLRVRASSAGSAPFYLQ